MPPKKPTPRPKPQPKRRTFTRSELEIIRKDLLVDRKAKELARILKISIEEYADKVVQHLSPGGGPVWKSLPDAKLRKLGFKVPTLKQLEKTLQTAAKAAEKALSMMKTAFVARDDKSERIGGNTPAPAPVDEASLDPALLEEVSKKRAK